MRIGLSVGTLEPARARGRIDGIGVYTSHLMAGLAARGQEVQGFSFPGFSFPAFSLPGLGRRGGPTLGRPLGLPFPAAALGAIASGGRLALAPPVDVFHATDYRIVPMRCPVVATLHDAIPMADPALSSRRLRGLKNALMRRLARFADVVVAVSAFSVAELVEHFGIDPARVRVIHAGVDPAWLTPPEPALLARVLAARRLEPGYFLSVGTLQPRKNVERILAAHALLPAALRRERPLVVVGRPGWRCDGLVAELRARVAAGEARWLADVAEPEELRALYAAAGVFVFPSLHEGFGLPVLEAFASGVPVVTANTTSLPEVSAGIAREVDPTSVEAIAEAMAALAAPGEERRRRIAAGRARARALGWEVMVDRLLALYRELA